MVRKRVLGCQGDERFGPLLRCPQLLAMLMDVRRKAQSIRHAQGMPKLLSQRDGILDFCECLVWVGT
jgi:hypothetical protein